ncbi:BON domain-containing protein [candidate division KSB1 bacterium]|nr:BON domain-containing protein [candidate division KSB1 bacterium]
MNNDKYTVRGLMVLLALFFAFSSVLAQQESLNDSDITLAIEAELVLDEAVASHLIDVSTKNGIVTLTGRVDNILNKERATRVAETIKGVRSVINNIEVVTPERSDKALSEDINAALLEDPATDSYEVGMVVDKGKVVLTGTVDSWQEKMLAGKVVKSVRGVKKVDNNIGVRYKSERSDFEIKQDIQRNLENDIWVDDGLIEIEVQDGNVMLSGTVGSADEKSRAITDAWVIGVNDVEAQSLEVKYWARDEMRRTRDFEKITDEEIKQAINDAFFQDPRVFSFHVDVIVENGNVTLSGVVDNLRSKSAAEQVARNTYGVWDVDNHIRVRPNTVPVNDTLKARVKRAMIRDPYVELHDLSIFAINGKVYLNGQVNTSYEKQRAQTVAERVKGVVDVSNNIKYEHKWTWKPDWKIRRAVNSQLFWSPFVDSDQVTLTIEDGVVTLSGNVDSWSEKSAAEDNAYEGGAREVNNNLNVKGKWYLDRYWYFR